MGRVLAIDYGEKRIGTALSDPNQIFPTPFLLVKNLGIKAVLTQLEKIIQEQGVERVVLGLPLLLDGTSTQKSDEVLGFFAKLKKRFNIPIELYDEAFSTKDAMQIVKANNTKKRGRKRDLDNIAASVILENYLNSRRNEKK